MAGSYSHITDDETGRFIGIDLIDNLGDAYEALEECYGMIQYLAQMFAVIPLSGGAKGLIEEARQHYKAGLRIGGAPSWEGWPEGYDKEDGE